VLAAQALVKRLIAVHILSALIHVAWLIEWVFKPGAANNHSGTPQAVHSRLADASDQLGSLYLLRTAFIPPSATAPSAPYRYSAHISVSLAPVKRMATIGLTLDDTLAG
jgi:hypothetical protein